MTANANIQFMLVFVREKGLGGPDCIAASSNPYLAGRKSTRCCSSLPPLMATCSSVLLCSKPESLIRKMHHSFFLSGQGTLVPPSVELLLALQTETLGLGWWSSSILPTWGLLDFHPQGGQRAAKICTGVKTKWYRSGERWQEWQRAAGGR